MSPFSRGQFGDDAGQQFRVEEAGGFGERPERGVADSESLADVIEVADLGQRPQAASDGVEHGEHDERCELIEVEGAIARSIAPAGLIVEVGEERLNPPEDLQPGEVAEGVGDLMVWVHAR